MIPRRRGPRGCATTARKSYDARDGRRSGRSPPGGLRSSCPSRCRPACRCPPACRSRRACRAGGPRAWPAPRRPRPPAARPPAPPSPPRPPPGAAAGLPRALSSGAGGAGVRPLPWFPATCSGLTGLSMSCPPAVDWRGRSGDAVGALALAWPWPWPWPWSWFWSSAPRRAAQAVRGRRRRPGPGRPGSPRRPRAGAPSPLRRPPGRRPRASSPSAAGMPTSASFSAGSDDASEAGAPSASPRLAPRSACAIPVTGTPTDPPTGVAGVLVAAPAAGGRGAMAGTGSPAGPLCRMGTAAVPPPMRAAEPMIITLAARLAPTPAPPAPSPAIVAAPPASAAPAAPAPRRAERGRQHLVQRGRGQGRRQRGQLRRPGLQALLPAPAGGAGAHVGLQAARAHDAPVAVRERSPHPVARHVAPGGQVVQRQAGVVDELLDDRGVLAQGPPDLLVPQAAQLAHHQRRALAVGQLVQVLAQLAQVGRQLAALLDPPGRHLEAREGRGRVGRPAPQDAHAGVVGDPVEPRPQRDVGPSGSERVR